MTKADMRRLIEEYEARGWTIVRKSKHYLWKAPDGETLITMSATPSDWRAIKNHLARVRKCENAAQFAL